MMQSTGSLRSMLHNWTVVHHGQRGEHNALSIASLKKNLLLDERFFVRLDIDNISWSVVDGWSVGDLIRFRNCDPSWEWPVVVIDPFSELWSVLRKWPVFGDWSVFGIVIRFTEVTPLWWLIRFRNLQMASWVSIVSISLVKWVRLFPSLLSALTTRIDDVHPPRLSLSVSVSLRSVIEEVNRLTLMPGLDYLLRLW